MFNFFVKFIERFFGSLPKVDTVGELAPYKIEPPASVEEPPAKATATPAIKVVKPKKANAPATPKAKAPKAPKAPASKK